MQRASRMLRLFAVLAILAGFFSAAQAQLRAEGTEDPTPVTTDVVESEPEAPASVGDEGTRADTVPAEPPPVDEPPSEEVAVEPPTDDALTEEPTTDAGGSDDADTPGATPVPDESAGDNPDGSVPPDAGTDDGSAPAPETGTTPEATNPATEEPAPPTDKAAGASEEVQAADHIGAVVAHTVDIGSGNSLPGSCFFVFRDTGVGPTEPGFLNAGCDGIDGANDGFTTVGGLAPGNYLLLQTVAPAGYRVGGTTAFAIEEVGEVVQLVVLNLPNGATLTISTVDASLAPLPGACFQLHADVGGGTQGVVVAFSCDGFDGVEDGTTVIGGLAPGAYVAVEAFAPTGYLVGAQTAFVIQPGQASASLQFVNQPGGATLTIFKVDQFLEPLPGVCFDVFVDAGGGALGAYVTTVCDGDDGSNDGTTFVGGLLPGNYVLHEFSVPHGFVPADFQVVVPAGQTAVEVTIQNVPLTGHVQILTCFFATDGEPRIEIDLLTAEPVLAAADGGCELGADISYTLTDAGTGAHVATLTTGLNGRAEIDLDPGNYILTEVVSGLAVPLTVASGGLYVAFVQLFVPADAVPENPGEEPTDPGTEGTGSVEIYVFACADGGTETQIVVAHPPAEQQGVAAAETGVDAAQVPDSCDNGTATLQIDDSDPFEVAIGTIFSNVLVGTYTLVERCSGTAAEVSVFAGATTKVLILDFGAPCAGTATPTPSPTPSGPPKATPAAPTGTQTITTLPVTGVAAVRSHAGSTSLALATPLALLSLGCALIGLRRVTAGRHRCGAGLPPS